jgi:hypothetical protein
MTLSEANSALRLYGLKMDRVLAYENEAGESVDGRVYRYTVASDRMIHDIGNWDLPIQEVYEHVVEKFT